MLDGILPGQKSQRCIFAWHGSYSAGIGLIVNLVRFRMKPALFQYAGTKDRIYQDSAGKALIVNLVRFRMKPALFQYAGTKDRIYLYSAGKGLMVNLVRFRMKPALFQYAGTKDRRARTTQEVTAYRYFKPLSVILKCSWLMDSSTAPYPLKLTIYEPRKIIK